MLLAFLAIGREAEAQPSFRAREGVAAGRVQALDRILEAIRRNHPGQLSDVQGPDPGPAGEPHYHIKWLTPDGRVLWLDTDARTGQVLGVQGGPQEAPPGDSFLPRQRFAPGGGPGGPAILPQAGPNSGPPFRRPLQDGDGRGPGHRFPYNR
jgi:hypothetical protein